MSIVLQGSTSGSITLQEPAVAGTTTINLPATSGTALVAPTALTVPNTTGTVMVSGNMPTFSAYQSSAQTLSSNTFTKLQFQTEEWDTASAFDNTTNYRFTPQVAGYYQVTGGMVLGASASNTLLVIYKNGSVYRYGVTDSLDRNQMTSMVYLNGSTDYIELYGRVVTGQVLDPSLSTFFQAALIRTA